MHGGTTGWGRYVALVVLFGGIWGTFAAAPAELYGYSNGTIYAIWSITMLVPATIALSRQPLDRRPRVTARAALLGLLGATGQLLLFSALAAGPAYLVFPIVSTTPAVTVLLAVLLLGERLRPAGVVALAAVLVAIVLLSLPDGAAGDGRGAWLPLALLVPAVWGTQGFLMRRAAVDGVGEATTFAWMAVGAVLMAPVALLLSGGPTLDAPWHAPLVTFGVQLLNACSALFLVMAMRRGRASVVSPVAGSLSPTATVLLSLVVARTVPTAIGTTAVLLAIGGSALMAWSDAAGRRSAAARAPSQPDARPVARPDVHRG